MRLYLQRRRIGVVIPTRADQEPLPSFDHEAYRDEHNIVERLINGFKRYRQVAGCYEKWVAS